MWPILLFCTILLGQLGRIQITPAIAIYISDVVLLLYVIFHLPFLWKERKQITAVSCLKPFLLVSIVCAMSLLVNEHRFAQIDVMVGIAYFLRYLLYAFVYVLVRLDKRPAVYWFKWVFVLGFGFALLGILQLFVYPDLRNLSYDGWDPHYYRLFSTLFDPNFMGSILLVSFQSGVLFIDKRKQDLAVLVGLATIFVAFLLTYSRSSYVAAIAVFIAYMLLTKRWKLAFWLLGFCVVLLYLPAIGGESTLLFRKFTAFARITNWQEGMQMFWESPVIGFGFNMVKSLSHNAPTLQSGVLAKSTSGYDNSIIFILVTTGSIGLAAFAYLWITMIRSGLHVFRIAKKSKFGLLYITILVASFVHSMFVNTLFYPQMMILLWIVTGAIEKEG